MIPGQRRALTTVVKTPKPLTTVVKKPKAPATVDKKQKAPATKDNTIQTQLQSYIDGLAVVMENHKKRLISIKDNQANYKRLGFHMTYKILVDVIDIANEIFKSIGEIIEKGVRPAAGIRSEVLLKVHHISTEHMIATEAELKNAAVKVKAQIENIPVKNPHPEGWDDKKAEKKFLTLEREGEERRIKRTELQDIIDELVEALDGLRRKMSRGITQENATQIRKAYKELNATQIRKYLAITFWKKIATKLDNQNLINNFQLHAETF